MPPKRRGAQAKAAASAPKAGPPDPPKPSLSSKSVPTPTPAPAPAPVSIPPPPPPPPQPVETGATKVRKEWSKFIDAWYEPRKKKLVEKLQRDILIKYKNLGTPKETQKLREMELFEKLDSLAQQLAQPARAEWERRLELAQLREDQWDDMSGEEQHAVMSVFVGFFADDVEDMDDDDDDVPADLSSIEEEESIIEEPQYRGTPSYLPSSLASSSKQSIPPTPIRGNFEFVNPTSFFADTMTPLNPTKNLPALSIDHLATLGPSNAGRSAEPVSASVGGTFSFQNWASEAGIVTQQPPGQSAKPPSAIATPSPPAAASAQTLSARPRATDIISRQVSTASNLSSAPLKISSPQYSPPNPSNRFSPPSNTENLPLGKRYIGPIITEEEPDPLDEELLRSKMADEYQQYKISLRIQMIYQFHAEAAEVEIKLFETLLAGEGTKESRARAVQEHETHMVHLRDQKEEDRKKLCAEERERRREELRQHLTQRRSGAQNQVDPGVRANPSKPGPDKLSVQERPGKAIHQKENIPISQPVVAPSTKLEPPSIIKKSLSSLSQGEASANEAIFANAMAMMAQGTAGAAVLTPAQASLNEAVFSNVAAALATQGQHGSNGKTTLQPPSIMKKSNSSRSQEHDIPHITVSFAESPAAPAPEPAPAPPTTGKGKKAKKGQAAVQPPTKPIVTVAEPEMVAEPPAPSLWDAATGIAKSGWGAVSPSIPIPASRFSATVEEEPDFDFISKTAPSKTNVSSKKPTSAGKKGKKVMITEEPDVDAEPIISPPPSSKPKATKGGWGSVNDRPNLAPASILEQSEPGLTLLPPVAPGWGKKTAPPVTKPTLKPQMKVVISEEQESEFEQSPAPAPAQQANKAKSAWGVTPSAAAGSQSSKKAKVTQQQAEPPRGAKSKSPRVETVPDPEDNWPETVTGDSTMSRTQFAGSEDANEEEEEEEEEGDTSAWFNPENISYWADFMGGQSEAEPEAQTVLEDAEQTGKHVRWTPAVDGESDEEEFGEGDEELETNMWMQYAISGQDVPAWGGAAEEPRLVPSESTQGEANLWERGAGKKKKNPPTGDSENRAQQTSVLDRAALTGQWPKMESWLSPPSRGQSSGSTRVF